MQPSELQTTRTLRRGKLADVNALNAGGPIVLDTPYDLLHSECLEFVIDIQEPRAMPTRDLNKQKINHSDDYSHRGLIIMPNIGFRRVLLLITTLIATITCQVPFHLRGSTFEEGYKQGSIMSSSFILWNSVVFMASVSIIIFLLHEFPLKPWPQISVLVIFCSYIFNIAL